MTIEAGTFKATKIMELDIKQNILVHLDIQPNQEVKIYQILFIGAKEVDLLDYYSENLSLSMFDRAVDFGWFYLITKPLFQILHWFSSIFLEM